MENVPKTYSVAFLDHTGATETTQKCGAHMLIIVSLMHEQSNEPHLPSK